MPNPSGPAKWPPLVSLVESSCFSSHSPRLFTGGSPPSVRPLDPRRAARGVMQGVASAQLAVRLASACPPRPPVHQTSGQPPGTRLCVAVCLKPFSFFLRGNKGTFRGSWCRVAGVWPERSVGPGMGSAGLILRSSLFECHCQRATRRRTDQRTNGGRRVRPAPCSRSKWQREVPRLFPFRTVFLCCFDRRDVRHCGSRCSPPSWQCPCAGALYVPPLWPHLTAAGRGGGSCPPRATISRGRRGAVA